MNQKTVRQLKVYARQHKIDFHRLKERWESTPWTLRHAFREEVQGKIPSIVNVKPQKATKAKPVKTTKAKTTKKKSTTKKAS